MFLHIGRIPELLNCSGITGLKQTLKGLRGNATSNNPRHSLSSAKSNRNPELYVFTLETA